MNLVKIIFLGIYFFIVTISCDGAEEEVLYNYFISKTYGDTSFFSVSVDQRGDTLFKTFYYGLNSDHSIDKSKGESYSFDILVKDQIFVNGVLELKLSQGVECWKSRYEEDINDSVQVCLDTILKEKRINDIVVNSCYVYNVKYDNSSRPYDTYDYKLYYDSNRKIILKRVFYNRNGIIAKEVMRSITPRHPARMNKGKR